MTIPSSEGNFWNVTVFDSELMIIRYEVYLPEMSSTLKLVKHVINPGDRILILDCDLVQLFMVNTHSEKIVFLPYK